MLQALAIFHLAYTTCLAGSMRHKQAAAGSPCRYPAVGWDHEVGAWRGSCDGLRGWPVASLS